MAVVMEQDSPGDAEDGRTPSSASVASPEKVITSPARNSAPFTGDVIACSGGFPTEMAIAPDVVVRVPSDTSRVAE